MNVLIPSEHAVVAGLEGYEIVFAKNQPEYNPLRLLQSFKPEGACLSRWTLTPEQRTAIANGEDLYLEQWTFHQPLQPVRLSVGIDVETVRREYGFPELEGPQ